MKFNFLILINKLKRSSSTGPEGLPAVLFKELKMSLLLPLKLIYTTSVQKGGLPDIWKIDCVIPIDKNDDKSCVSNYKPISLTLHWV